MAEDHAGNQSYDENFYRMQKDGSYRSASIILPILMRYIHPRNVIDVGCGVGTWLAVWKNFGVDVHGVDGDYVDRTQLFIPEANFQPVNLEARFSTNAKFDLVETLEVAEHLTPNRADTFVEDLTKLGDVILFSAAIAGQGGVNHVNEQMQSYWAERFMRQGYVAIDLIRPQIWNNKQIEFWYRQNTLIYAKTSELYRYPALQKYYLDNRESTIVDAVHPEVWVGRLIYFQNVFNHLQQQLANQNRNDNRNISGGGGRYIKFIIVYPASKSFRRQKVGGFFVVDRNGGKC